ncbi:epsin-1 isoform X2 [Pteropus medius]|uniref:epsin-1 isoform X2 n=1 Tax=Pteropus vampyrus TaxID=132908 RepID=UPI00196B6883|nr:epsin-1 isoform X2 [Pteropus giganteus]
MSTSSLRRQMKNIVHNYSEAEIKVREATSNDPWGPSSSLMSEIADLTYNVVAFSEIMSMIWKRLNDHGKNWRHVYKAMTLMEYLIKTGSERVSQQCKENMYAVQTLKDFQYVDRDGKDQGVNVREKAKQLVALLRDEDRLREERAHALKTKEKLAQTAAASSAAVGSGPLPEAEQAWPQSSGEEELQLQLALAMSKEEADQEERIRRGDDLRLQMAIEESRRETGARGSPPSWILRMSSRPQLLQQPRTRGVAQRPWAPPRLPPPQTHGADLLFRQLLILGVVRPLHRPLGTPGGLLPLWGPQSTLGVGPRPLQLEKGPRLTHGGARMVGPRPVDPRSPIPGPRPSQTPGGGHLPSPALMAPQWSGALTQSLTSSLTLTGCAQPYRPQGAAQALQVLAPGSATWYRHLLSKTLPPVFPLSPSAPPGELELLAGEVPARSPGAFDMSGVGGSLAEAVGSPPPAAAPAPTPPTRKTPESFLGPNAALVDLDSLVSRPGPTSQGAKASNPFLPSGAPATGPSVTNPFQPAPPATLTLNQLRLSPGPPVPGAPPTYISPLGGGPGLPPMMPPGPPAPSTNPFLL